MMQTRQVIDDVHNHTQRYRMPSIRHTSISMARIDSSRISSERIQIRVQYMDIFLNIAFNSIPTPLVKKKAADSSMCLSYYFLLRPTLHNKKKQYPGTHIHMPTPRPKQPTVLLLPPPPLYENNHLHTPHADSHEWVRK